MVDTATLLKLHKPLQQKAMKSPHKLQGASLVWDEKTHSIVGLENNEQGDSAISALDHIPWYKALFGNYVLISTFSPTIEAIEVCRKKHISHIFFFEHLNSAASLRLMKKYGILSTRLIITK